jgi:intein/homing endonuclease
MVDIALLKDPSKSHRKKVAIPKPSVFLAEFFGIMIGDGGINNDWQANITLNTEADAKFILFVSKLCNRLFKILPAIRKRKEKRATIVSLASTTVVDFLVDSGLRRGNKLKQGLEIPNWILSKKTYRIACVRGLMDTDGCLFIHKHAVQGKQYSNIGLSFTSASFRLIEQVSSVFEEVGITPHISGGGRNIFLYKESAVDRYIKIFGTSNDRIASVYKRWRDARVV